MKHPVHPLIVHFPIACWSLSTFGDIAGMFLTINLSQAIGVLMFIGCVSAVCAMAAGLYDVTKLKDIEQISDVIDHHMYAAITAWSFYLLSLYLRWEEGLSVAPNMWAAVTSIVGFICLMITGWYGANLVYVYGIGTKKVND